MNIVDKAVGFFSGKKDEEKKACACGQEHCEHKDGTTFEMKENVMPGSASVTASPEPPPPPELDSRDFKKLANSDYERVKTEFDTIFVIQHKKSKKIAELRAASPVHAANMLGWRPRQVTVLKTKSYTAEKG